MTDQLLYRLNRVPDRLYIKFLELDRRPAAAADAGAGTGHASGWRLRPSASSRSNRAPRCRRCAPTSTTPSSFATVDELRIIPCKLDARRDRRSRTPTSPTERRRMDRSDRPGEARVAVRCLPDDARGRRLRVPRAERGRPELRGRAAGRRATSTASVSTPTTRRWSGKRGTATDWESVRGRPRRHRWPEPRRPDRPARAPRPRGVSVPRGAGRLAASPRRRGRIRAAVVHVVAAHPRA